MGWKSREGEVFIIVQEVACGLFPEDDLHSDCKVPLAQRSREQSHVVCSQGQRFASLCSPKMLTARPGRCVAFQS